MRLLIADCRWLMANFGEAARRFPVEAHPRPHGSSGAGTPSPRGPRRGPQGHALALAALLAAPLAPAAPPLPAEGPSLCGGNVVVAGTTNATILGAAADLARCLSEATRRTFFVTNGVSPLGIVLGVTNEASVAAAPGVARLREKGTEAYLLHSDGSGRVWVVGNSAMGVEHGVYSFLGKLGFRWYLPGEAWAVTPALESVNGKLDLCDAPAFKVRNFFGTGGFGGKLPVDPDGRLARRWDLWKRRNLLGGEYSLGGHSYQVLNVASKAEMIAHPEYRAEIDGKRVEWSEGMKPCYSNPGLQALFTSNRLAALRRAVEADPSSPGAFAVTVEPSDGGGHCECTACRKLGSVSDRVFTLANVVARAVAKEFPGRYVNLLAYNEHAAVPSIPLEPNVLVKVVPYGFQRTGLTPEALIHAWRAKVKRLSLYDYWAIPDWARCMPMPWSLYLDRVRLWHREGIESFSSESVFSAGSAGLTWFLAARVLWDPAADERPLLDDFFHGTFGKAAPPMRRMMARWNVPETYFYLSEQELALAFRDLAEASQLAGNDEAVRARLDDFKRYLLYLQFWHECQEAPPKSPERTEKARRLILHCWRIYDSAMVHSSRMTRLIINRYEESAELKKEWIEKNGPGWATVTPLERPELDRLFAEGVAKYPPIEFEERTFSDQLVPFQPRLPEGAADPPKSWFTLYSHEFAFWVPEGRTAATLRFAFRPRDPDKRPENHLTVTAPDGKVVLDRGVSGNGEPQAIEVPTPVPGLYRAKVTDHKVGWRFHPSAGLHLAMVGDVRSGDLSPRVWFFVPKGLRRIVIRCENSRNFKLFDAEGKPVEARGERLVWADVPPGQDGRPWSFSGFKGSSPLRMLNCPRALSFTPETLLVPKECRP